MNTRLKTANLYLHWRALPVESDYKIILWELWIQVY